MKACNQHAIKGLTSAAIWRPVMKACNQHAIKGLTSAAIWRPVMKACCRDWPSRSTKSESVSP